MPMQNKAEQKFKEWLDGRNYAYLYVDQSSDTFSSFFRGIAKRPDFIVIIRHVGLIAVDVKGKSLFSPRGDRAFFTLDKRNDVSKHDEFERTTRIPVWFVFMNEEDDYDKQHWIPLSKVLTCELMRDRSGEEFFLIPQSECIVIQSSRDSISRIIEG